MELQAPNALLQVLENIEKRCKNDSKVVNLESFSVLVASLIDLFVVFDDLGSCRKIIVF